MSNLTRQAPATRLRDLVAELSRVDGGARLVPPDGDAEVADVTHDSREAGPGVLFACRPGARTDGHDHAPAAVAAGSPALLVERLLPQEVPQLVVAAVAEALGPVAARVHRHPAAELVFLGVTGTNGKTTTVYLLESILRRAGHVTGMVGTVETVVAGQHVAGLRTTPEATDLQRLLRRMRDAGVTAAAMEVSSHGLTLGRVRGARFAAALFTNLSRDHLDFHADMEDYFRAKASLFTLDYTSRAVVNVDDAHGRRLADAATGVEVVRVSAAGNAAADVVASDVVLGPHGVSFTARLLGGDVAVRSRLPGSFNVANVLGALALAETVGIDPETASAGVAACRGVPGRMERVDAGQPFTVLVDYAHKPGALDSVLRSARQLTAPGGRVFVVVGCGGDRDRGKRPLMGRTAAALADVAVLTSDNPRSEDPEAILAEMVAGAAEVPGANWSVVVDRRAAIDAALRQAGPGDVVVVAGKGHETTQELATGMVAFDDRVVAGQLLAARYGGGDGR